MIPPPAPIPGPSYRIWAGVAGRWIVGSVFFFSGLSKAAAPAQEFAAVLEGYYLLPDGMIPFMSRAFPWAELLLGAYLLAGLCTRACSIALGAMLLCFEGALGIALSKGVPLDNCGCFGQSLHLKPWQAMTLDALLLALCWLAYRGGNGAWSLDRWVESAGRGPGAGGAR